MKIEIYLTEKLHEKISCLTCFDAKEYIKKALCNSKAINGIVIINDIAIKFHFSPNGMDGDIFTDNPTYRTIIKSLIPAWYYSNFL